MAERAERRTGQTEPPVPSKDVVAAARGADAGIWTFPALCRNFTFALPNKIFEYLAADLPVLVAHYPEAKRLVLESEVGLTFDPYDPHSIAESINRLVQDEPFLMQLRRQHENSLSEAGCSVRMAASSSRFTIAFVQKIVERTDPRK